MSALKNMPISFPGLFGDWELNIDPVAIHIGHGIYWYGIILAFAMLAGLYLCMKQAKHYGLTEDNVMDMVLWAVPCCIIGCPVLLCAVLSGPLPEYGRQPGLGRHVAGSGTAAWPFTAR